MTNRCSSQTIFVLASILENVVVCWLKAQCHPAAIRDEIQTTISFLTGWREGSITTGFAFYFYPLFLLPVYEERTCAQFIAAVYVEKRERDL
uniref:Secreted protein n=1 Tax=Ditylenchus dipsaci TaxID=166011 RepID=A0A915D2M4_9BILA